MIDMKNENTNSTALAVELDEREQQFLDIEVPRMMSEMWRNYDSGIGMAFMFDEGFLVEQDKKLAAGLYDRHLYNDYHVHLESAEFRDILNRKVNFMVEPTNCFHEPFDKEFAQYEGSANATALLDKLWEQIDEVMQPTLANDVLERVIIDRFRYNASYVLGHIYCKGIFVEPDYDRSIFWFRDYIEDEIMPDNEQVEEIYRHYCDRRGIVPHCIYSDERIQEIHEMFSKPSGGGLLLSFDDDDNMIERHIDADGKIVKKTYVNGKLVEEVKEE